MRENALPKLKEIPLARVTRRGFLTKAFAAGAGLAVGAPSLMQLVSFKDEVKADSGTTSTGPQWTMVIDLRKCDGCQACTKACQSAHNLWPDQTWIKVYQMQDTEGQSYFMPRPCMQCQDAPCVKVCPVGASFRNSDGVVLIDQNACIGCRMCMAACPYEARYFNWYDPPAETKRLPFPASPEYPFPQQKGTAGKCTLCSDQLKMGMAPHCVDACHMGVLYIGDFTSDVAVNGLGDTVKLSKFLADNDAVRFKDELNTNPRVYYILGHGQELA